MLLMVSNCGKSRNECLEKQIYKNCLEGACPLVMEYNKMRSNPNLRLEQLEHNAKRDSEGYLGIGETCKWNQVLGTKCKYINEIVYIFAGDRADGHVAFRVDDKIIEWAKNLVIEQNNGSFKEEEFKTIIEKKAYADIYIYKDYSSFFVCRDIKSE